MYVPVSGGEGGFFVARTTARADERGAQTQTQTHKFPFILTLTFEFLMKFQTFLTPRNCFPPQAARAG